MPYRAAAVEQANEPDAGAPRGDRGRPRRAARRAPQPAPPARRSSAATSCRASSAGRATRRCAPSCAASTSTRSRVRRAGSWTPRDDAYAPLLEPELERAGLPPLGRAAALRPAAPLPRPGARRGRSPTRALVRVVRSRRSPGSASTSARSERPPRHRAAADQEPARLLLDAARPGRDLPRRRARRGPRRLRGAVPRGRPRRALRQRRSRARVRVPPSRRQLGHRVVRVPAPGPDLDPAWLEARLGVGDPAEIEAHERAARLVMLRRYAAKLEYELALHGRGADLGEMPQRYAGLLGAATAVEWPRVELAVGRRSRLLRRPATCAPGRSTRSGAGRCGERFGERWFADARGGRVATRSVGAGSAAARRRAPRRDARRGARLHGARGRVLPGRLRPASPASCRSRRRPTCGSGCGARSRGPCAARPS